MQLLIIATTIVSELVVVVLVSGVFTSAWPVIVTLDRTYPAAASKLVRTAVVNTQLCSVSYDNDDGDNDDDDDEKTRAPLNDPDHSLILPNVVRSSDSTTTTTTYDLGANKNPPVGKSLYGIGESAADHWIVPAPVAKPSSSNQPPMNGIQPTTTATTRAQAQKQKVPTNAPSSELKFADDSTVASSYPAPPPPPSRRATAAGGGTPPKRVRRMVARDQQAQKLRAALWDEQHFDTNRETTSSSWNPNNNDHQDDYYGLVKPPAVAYPNIDMSIPDTVYNEGDNGKPAVDLVWDNLRWEAYQEAQREPLLVSFLYSTILNHKSLESSLAFLLANRLQSPAMMMSTQLQSILKDTLEMDPAARRYLRCDMMAVRDRDPACNALTDVFLYFKGFHALQSHRVAHNLWRRGKRILSSYLQSQVSQVFQIDIHPNATMKSGIMLDHGTGLVIGSTASVGHNCSILHHVTLGGSGKKGLRRHPSVGDGVLLGAGATVLGPVNLGDGSQVGAGTLVISDLPAHCVAVGVPARIIGSFIDVTMQPSVGMDQMIEGNAQVVTFESDGI